MEPGKEKYLFINFNCTTRITKVKSKQKRFFPAMPSITLVTESGMSVPKIQFVCFVNLYMKPACFCPRRHTHVVNQGVLPMISFKKNLLIISSKHPLHCLRDVKDKGARNRKTGTDKHSISLSSIIYIPEDKWEDMYSDCQLLAVGCLASSRCVNMLSHKLCRWYVP